MRGQARQKVQLQQLQSQLDKIQTFLIQNRHSLDDDDDDENVELPIQNLKDLRKFDSRLEKEKKLRKYLVNLLSTIYSYETKKNKIQTLTHFFQNEDHSEF